MTRGAAIPEETVACPLCGGRGITFYRENDRRFERCPCGLVYQNPRPAADWIRRARYTPYDTGAAHRRQMNGLYEHAARALPPGRVLDVGCGPGIFVRMLRERGWEAEGIDLDPAPGMRRGDFLEADFRGPYDAVTAFYVLEHVVDPRRFIQRVSDLLRPGGLFYARVPHTSPIVRIGKIVAPRWNFYHTPWHLQDFPPSVLQRLFRGWRVRIDRTPTARGSWARWIPLPGRSYTIIAEKLESGR